MDENLYYTCNKQIFVFCTAHTVCAQQAVCLTSICPPHLPDMGGASGLGAHRPPLVIVNEELDIGLQYSPNEFIMVRIGVYVRLLYFLGHRYVLLLANNPIPSLPCVPLRKSRAPPMEMSARPVPAASSLTYVTVLLLSLSATYIRSSSHTSFRRRSALAEQSAPVSAEMSGKIQICTECHKAKELETEFGRRTKDTAGGKKGEWAARCLHCMEAGKNRKRRAAQKRKLQAEADGEDDESDREDAGNPVLLEGSTLPLEEFAALMESKKESPMDVKASVLAPMDDGLAGDVVRLRADQVAQCLGDALGWRWMYVLLFPVLSAP